MTLLNPPSDGLPNEFIVLARVAAESGPLDKDELVQLCSVDGLAPRLRGALSRWTSVGFFLEATAGTTLSDAVRPRPREGIDLWTTRLPAICRQLALADSNCSPLFGAEMGTSADLVKGLAWILAQDIFSFSAAWKDVDALEARQLQATDKVIQNDVRWNALRFWARYLGFASSHRGFFVDPTSAIRDEIKQILNSDQPIAADVFVNELARRLPILDGGSARLTVEEKLNPQEWTKQNAGELSTSLSFALHRLELEQMITLEKLSDTAQGFILLGKGHRQKKSPFTHVRLRTPAK